MIDWSQLISAADAEEKYNKQPGTIRKAIVRGKFEIGKDCMKYGKQWVLTVEAVEREYAESKGEK